MHLEINPLWWNLLQLPAIPWLVAHFIGDYFLQNDFMAQGKKKPGMEGHLKCLLHVVVYAIPFLFVTVSDNGIKSIVIMALILIQHYILDRTHLVEKLMIIKGSAIFAKGPCFPWSQIVMDNLWHCLWIWFLIDYVGPLIK
jgi:hypothetical protein